MYSGVDEVLTGKNYIERAIEAERLEKKHKNRIIKFRGKRLDNGEWVYGYYWANKSATRETPHIVNEYGDIFQIDTETVGQFTGLYDKNGKEIYEGDIVRVAYSEYEDETIHEIKYFVEEYNYPAFDLEPCIDFADGNSFQYAKLMLNIEVISNIHDNKEILK